MLVDEKGLWPDGQFADHVPDRPHRVPAEAPGDRRGAAARPSQKSIDFANADQAPGQDGDERRAQAARRQLVAGPGGPRPRLQRAVVHIDPIAGTFPQLSKDSVTAGRRQKETDLAGFFDLAPLNNVLTAAGKPTVDAAGLDKAQG